MSKGQKKFAVGLIGALMLCPLSAEPPPSSGPLPAGGNDGVTLPSDKSRNGSHASERDAVASQRNMVFVTPTHIHQTRSAVREGPSALAEAAVSLAIAPDENALLVAFLTVVLLFGWLNDPRGWRGWNVPWWTWGWVAVLLALWCWHVWCWENPNGWPNENLRKSLGWWGSFVVAYSAAHLHQKICCTNPDDCEINPASMESKRNS